MAAERAGRDARTVEVLATTKYVAIEDLPRLVEAGIRLVGENRAIDLEEKASSGTSGAFNWDFIGQLQSRRVRKIVPYARLIHSVASESAMRELAKHRDRAKPGLRILIQVNVAGDESKAGVPPGQLDAMIESAPVPVAGLMTMPPFAEDPEDSRRWFTDLRELAQDRGLHHLSMGTSQDYAVAIEEGATIIRLGRILYEKRVLGCRGRWT